MPASRAPSRALHDLLHLSPLPALLPGLLAGSHEAPAVIGGVR